MVDLPLGSIGYNTTVSLAFRLILTSNLVTFRLHSAEAINDYFFLFDVTSRSCRVVSNGFVDS